MEPQDVAVRLLTLNSQLGKWQLVTVVPCALDGSILEEFVSLRHVTR